MEETVDFPVAIPPVRPTTGDTPYQQLDKMKEERKRDEPSMFEQKWEEG